MTHNHRSFEERLSALEEENRRLRERLDRAEGKSPPDDQPISRRALLAQTGVAIGIGATLGVVGIGSALIRVSWLNAIRRRAER